MLLSAQTSKDRNSSGNPDKRMNINSGLTIHHADRRSDNKPKEWAGCLAATIMNAPQTVKQLRETTYEPDRQIWHTSFAALQNCSLLYASGLCVPAKYPRGMKLLFMI